MMTRMFNGWNVIRWVRIALGIAAVVQGILQKEGWLAVAGTAILIAALLNVGCCGSTGCSLPSSKRETDREITYEEVDSTK